MQEPRWTEVDGVPTAWVDVPGNLRAALVFRSGVANETLPTHGVTHLVEHLALHGMHDRPYPLNGMVDLTRTMFWASGAPEEITEFLGSVCAGLGDLPGDRVEIERQVLAAEADARSTTFRDLLMWFRYGATAHGLVGEPEYGLRWLDEKTVRWWAAERFTRTNAMLLLSGPPPAGLRLPLADAPLRPPVVANAVEQVIPGWAPAAAAGVGMSGVARRSVAAKLAGALLDSELARVLRFERGLTYSISSGYEVLDAEHAHVTFSADADDAHHVALRDAFLEVVGRLADQGPDPATLARLLERSSRTDDEERLLGHLIGLGIDFSVGRPYEAFTKVDEELGTVTPEAVTEAVREIADSALFALPHGVEMPDTLPAIPLSSAETVAGDTYRGWTRPGAVVVGPEGVTCVQEGTVATVRWRDAVGLLWWGDGARMVVGRDGFRVRIVPADWEHGDRAVTAIDSFAPRHAAVPMGDVGPGPAAPPGYPAASPRRRTFGYYWVALACSLFLAVSLIVRGIAGPAPATATRGEVTEADATGMLVTGIVGLLLCLWGAVTLARRARRDRSSQTERRSVPS